MQRNRRREGRKGEEEAEKFLKREGYKILEKNFRSPFGEVDIVAEEDDAVVFVEVKKRTSPIFGTAAEAVDRKKRDKIIKTALFYMKKRKNAGKRVRFDVVGIDGERIRIIRNAFEAEG